EEERHAPPTHALHQAERAQHEQESAIALEDMVIPEREDAVVVREAAGEPADAATAFEHRDRPHASFRERRRSREPAHAAAEDDDALQGAPFFASAIARVARSSLPARCNVTAKTTHTRGSSISARI